MNYRISQILAEKTLASSGTEVIDLDVKDPVSMLLFEYKNTPGSNTMADHVAACLSKIELIDGADVLFSLSGKQLHALSYYDTKQVPETLISNAVGVQQLLCLRYHFGRRLWDTLLALDPKRFRNPQLKVTHNRLTSDASSTAHTLKVLGFLFDEKAISPQGFLMSKELKSYTAGAENSYEYTDLPTDHPLRKLLVYAYDDAYQPWQVANEIRLSEDNDKRVPVDEKMSTLMREVNSQMPFWRELVYAVLTTTAIDIHVTPNFQSIVSGMGNTQGTVIDVEGHPHHSPMLIGANASDNCSLQIHGYQPHAVIPLLFGDQDDPSDWYDVTKLGNLKARVKAGSAGTAGAIALFTQQYRRY